MAPTSLLGGIFARRGKRRSKLLLPAMRPPHRASPAEPRAGRVRPPGPRRPPPRSGRRRRSRAGPLATRRRSGRATRRPAPWRAQARRRVRPRARSTASEGRAGSAAASSPRLGNSAAQRRREHRVRARGDRAPRLRSRQLAHRGRPAPGRRGSKLEQPPFGEQLERLGAPRARRRAFAARPPIRSRETVERSARRISSAVARSSANP